MSSSWPAVHLGEILTERRERPPAADLALGRIRIVEKISFETGRLKLREGGQTKTGMITVRPGDLIVSGINAAKGAIAIYPDYETEPIAATIHYGAYTPISRKVSLEFLWWMLRSRFFKKLLSEYVPGGIKTELKSSRLLPIPIPLPPLSEQRRIVARIGELGARIDESHRLQEEILRESEALIVSTHIRLSGTRTRKLGQILRLDEDSIAIVPSQSYPQVGIRSFGAGLFGKSAVTGAETAYRGFNRLYEGAVILSQVKGWEGAVAVCGPEFAGWFASPEYRTFRCDPTEARPSYLAALVRTEWFWSRLAQATRGVGARRERTRPEQFVAIEIPVPELEQQRRGEAVFAQLHAAKQLQTETTIELDTLLPSILDRAFNGEL